MSGTTIVLLIIGAIIIIYLIRSWVRPITEEDKRIDEGVHEYCETCGEFPMDCL